jgi:hypothetical protein
MAHHQDGKKWYVDTDFINKVQYAYPKAVLNHMGFGEFYLETPDGRLDFNRMAGKNFDGQSGRSHLLQDDKNGKVIKKAIKHMERARKSERLAALETRIAKLQSKVASGLNNKRASILQTKIAHLEYKLGKPTAAKVKKVAVKVLTAGKFELGRVVQTRGVNHKSRENPQFKRDVDNAFRKYMRGDWGISKDKRMNDRAVKNGDDRIMGVYPTSEGDIWIITEWDRSVTTMLFPSEY